MFTGDTHKTCERCHRNYHYSTRLNCWKYCDTRCKEGKCRKRSEPVKTNEPQRRQDSSEEEEEGGASEEQGESEPRRASKRAKADMEAK